MYLLGRTVQKEKPNTTKELDVQGIQGGGGSNPPPINKGGWKQVM
jgi:hypothetical protein